MACAVCPSWPRLRAAVLPSLVRLCVLVQLTAVVTATAASILQLRNLNDTAGDGWLVFDPVSGMEWLKLTATRHIPATTVHANFRPGLQYHGWRYG